MREYVYRERQVGWGLLFGVFVSLAVALPIARHLDPQHGVVLHVVLWAAFASIVLFLGRLTIEVGGGELRWYFGWLGWPGGRVALGEVVRVEDGAFRWSEGWGIKRTSSGMLYNITGHQTLRIVLRDGSSFRLGTTDPRALRDALLPRIAGTRR